MIGTYEDWHKMLKDIIKNPDHIFALTPRNKEEREFFKGLVEYLNENSEDFSAYIGSDNKVNFMIKLNHEDKYQLMYENIISNIDDDKGYCIGYPEEQTDIFQGFCKWLNENHPNLNSKIENDILIIEKKK